MKTAVWPIPSSGSLEIFIASSLILPLSRGRSRAGTTILLAPVTTQLTRRSFSGVGAIGNRDDRPSQKAQIRRLQQRACTREQGRMGDALRPRSRVSARFPIQVDRSDLHAFHGSRAGY